MLQESLTEDNARRVKRQATTDITRQLFQLLQEQRDVEQLRTHTAPCVHCRITR